MGEWTNDITEITYNIIFGFKDSDWIIDENPGRDVDSVIENCRTEFNNVLLRYQNGGIQENEKLQLTQHTISWSKGQRVNWNEIAETVLANYDETHCLNCKNETEEDFCTGSCAEEYGYAGVL